MSTDLAYEDLKKELVSLPFPIHASPSATSKALTSAIAALQLHPTLEAAFHLLNADLPSAHFLVRHMQSPPAVEGMTLHALLHRIEGDYPNTRAWLTDVFSASPLSQDPRTPDSKTEKARKEVGDFVLRVWGTALGSETQSQEEEEMGGLEEARDRALGLTDAVEGLRKGNEKEGDVEVLRKRCKEEMGRVLGWCEGKFGIERIVDATGAWVKPMEHVKKIGEEQVSGGKGWREF